jgi:hypothetical protein
MKRNEKLTPRREPPELAALRYRFQHDLEEGLLMLLRSRPRQGDSESAHTMFNGG